VVSTKNKLVFGGLRWPPKIATQNRQNYQNCQKLTKPPKINKTAENCNTNHRKYCWLIFGGFLLAAENITGLFFVVFY
jgi:hypothetical protein